MYRFTLNSITTIDLVCIIWIESGEASTLELQETQKYFTLE